MASLQEMTDLHRDRYIRHTFHGMTVAEIAKQDHITPKQVKKSITLMANFRQMCTLTELDAANVDMLIRLGGKQFDALNQMLSATKGRSNAPDHAARAKALEIMTDMADGVRPKGKGAMVNVGIMANGQAQVQTEQQTVTGRNDFESILRRIRQRQTPQLTSGEALSSGESDDQVVTLDVADPTQE